MAIFLAESSAFNADITSILFPVEKTADSIVTVCGFTRHLITKIAAKKQLSMLSMSLTVRDSRSLELLFDGRRVGKFVVIFLTCQTTVHFKKTKIDGTLFFLQE